MTAPVSELADSLSPPRVAWRQTVFPVLVLSAVVWAVFGASLGNRLVFDDLDTIKNNTAITRLQNLPLVFSRKYFDSAGEYSYRPVVTLSYFLDHAIAGKSAWIYHAHNVLLHHLNVLLVFALFNLLYAPRAAAFAIALLFAIHPLHTEAVIFPGFREDLQMTLGMLALGCCLQADRRNKSPMWIAAASAAYAFALFAKEGALPAPLIWWLNDLLQTRRALMPLPLRRRYFSLLVVGMAYVIIRFAVMVNPAEKELGVIEQIPLAHRLATAPYLFAYYLRKFVWPYPLCIISEIEGLRDFGTAFQISLAAVAAFLAVWLIIGWRQPWLWPAGLWAGAAFAPVSNLYPIINLWAERFYYSVGVGTAAIAVAGAMEGWTILARRLAPPQRHSAAVTVWIVLIVAAWAAVLTDFVRVLECRTSLSLWRRTVRTVPTSGTALSTLAKYELDAGNYDRVEALTDAMQRHDPWVFRVHWILGENAFRQQKWSEAIGHFEKAVSVPTPAPGDEIPAAVGLIRSYLQLERRDLAKSVLEKLMRQYPKDVRLMELQRQIEPAGDDSLSSPTSAKFSGNF